VADIQDPFEQRLGAIAKSDAERADALGRLHDETLIATANAWLQSVGAEAAQRLRQAGVPFEQARVHRMQKAGLWERMRTDFHPPRQVYLSEGDPRVSATNRALGRRWHLDVGRLRDTLAPRVDVTQYGSLELCTDHDFRVGDPIGSPGQPFVVTVAIDPAHAGLITKNVGHDAGDSVYVVEAAADLNGRAYSYYQYGGRPPVVRYFDDLVAEAVANLVLQSRQRDR
jgi:hypothetical protein